MPYKRINASRYQYRKRPVRPVRPRRKAAPTMQKKVNQMWASQRKDVKVVDETKAAVSVFTTPGVDPIVATPSNVKVKPLSLQLNGQVYVDAASLGETAQVRVVLFREKQKTNPADATEWDSLYEDTGVTTFRVNDLRINSGSSDIVPSQFTVLMDKTFQLNKETGGTTHSRQMLKIYKKFNNTIMFNGDAAAGGLKNQLYLGYCSTEATAAIKIEWNVRLRYDQITG